MSALFESGFGLGDDHVILLTRQDQPAGTNKISDCTQKQLEKLATRPGSICNSEVEHIGYHSWAVRPQRLDRRLNRI